MPAHNIEPRPTRRDVALTEYRGKQTKTGNSSGFRFEGALFKSHPEFNGDVTAHILAPGRMLVTAEPTKPEEADPVMAAFLAFLAQDMIVAPKHIHLLDSNLANRIDRLVEGVQTSPEEKLAGKIVL